MCNIEFPHFGASYPDAHCIDGYLWDMDSYEDGYYTIGGDDPCPFCNTEEWLKTVLDNEEFASREEALEWVEKMREKWGAEHRGSSEITKDLEEAAVDIADALLAKPKDYALSAKADYWNGAHDGIIAGAKWKKEQIISALKNDGDLPIEFIDKFHEIDRAAFQNGQANMKEQMMKEAVEISYKGGMAIINCEEKPFEGGTVRVIFLPKED